VISGARGTALLAGTYCVQGAILLLLPGRVGDALGAGTAPPRWLIRLLGARLLGQGLLTGLRRNPLVLRLGSGTDLAHAISMAGVAALAPNYRRAAIASATGAVGTAVAGAALARCPQSGALPRR